MQAFMVRLAQAGYREIMMIRFAKTLIVSLSWLAVSVMMAAANSNSPVRVVELFTSQGCSSCPPANKFTRKLAAEDPDTLVLSYGVTYWDYLGWKDTFGQKQFTARQGQYRDALGTNMYTPQMVINGVEDGPRFKKRQIRQHVLPVQVNLVRHQDRLVLGGDLPVGATIAIVDFTPGMQSVSVHRGENRGRTMTLANVVTDIDYERWTGRPLSLTIPREGRAVLVHDPRSRQIIAAASYVMNGPV